MTLAQLSIVGVAIFAVMAAAIFILAIRSPRGSSRKPRFAIAALMLFAAVVEGWNALMQLHRESSVPRPYILQTPGWSIVFPAAALLFSLYLLGDAIIKGPRDPEPPAEGR